ncbi:hypothetical protein AB4Z38_05010 [Arthrobacter sp. 2RAF6]|uniref:hypothetical protein n=1 Tax=Arthrobacter sp. 2RAF6 TaxID=3233002 RepID=UPI003F931CA8
MGNSFDPFPARALACDVFKSADPRTLADGMNPGAEFSMARIAGLIGGTLSAATLGEIVDRKSIATAETEKTKDTELIFTFPPDCGNVRFAPLQVRACCSNHFIPAIGKREGRPVCRKKAMSGFAI